ncbi:MAG: hypothetical protein ACYC4L_04785 [Chloroflexota bacterium]
MRLTKSLIRTYAERSEISVEPCELAGAVDHIMADWATKAGYSRQQVERALWIWASSAIYELLHDADFYATDRRRGLDYEVFDQALGEPAAEVAS